jgi:hypothetical protein
MLCKNQETLIRQWLVRVLQAVGLGLVNSPKERNGRMASVDSQATLVEYARKGAHPG